MVIYPHKLEQALSNINDQPIYALEILWADGKHGTENVNDIYFTTADVSEIAGFPYPDRVFPILDPKKVSSISQKLDAKNGTSTIGSMVFDIIDVDGVFSKIVTNADIAGHGLRRQRCELYMLDKTIGWASRVKTRTLQIDDLDHDIDKGRYQLKCVDINRLLKSNIFEPAVSYLAANITSTAVYIAIGSSSAIADLTFITQPVYGTSCFIKIEDEIIKLSAYNTGTNVATVAASGRGQFGTVAAAHTIPSEGMVVNEIVVLRGNPMDIAIKALSLGIGGGGAYDVYPSKWTVGLDPAGTWPELDLVAWEDLAAFTGYDKTAATPASTGIQYEFLFDKGIEAKQFIEQTILRTVGGFSKIRGDGAYSCARLADISSISKASISAGMTLTIEDVVKWGKLRYRYSKMSNIMRIDYDETPVLSGKFVRNTYFYDQASQIKWGSSNELRFKAPGMLPLAENINTMYSRFLPLLARTSNPPLGIKIEAVRKWSKLEAGDVIRLLIPAPDLTQSGADVDRVFEVVGVSTNSWTGNVSLDLEAQPTQVQLDQLTTSFIGDLPPRSNSVAYARGALLTDINLQNYGTKDVASTAYYFAGDQTLSSTVTVSGDVIIFIDGVLTISPNGYFEGIGRGTTGSRIPFNAGGWPYGSAPDNFGLTAKGGRGGSVGTSGNRGWGALDTNPPSFSAKPIVGLYLGWFDTSTPPVASFIYNIHNTPFWGGGGGSGGYDPGASIGGDGGAGLRIICRGINMQSGAKINLSGTAGATGVGGGGGGAAGDLGIFVELAAGGLGTTRIINESNIFLNGGSAGTATLAGYGTGAAWGFNGSPQAGADGLLISEVF